MGNEHQKLRETIHRITGLKIEEDKTYLIETRLSDLMREYKLATYDDVSAILLAGTDKHFIDRVIEKITTHETRFFRDESIFNALLMQIIPEWMERKGITRSRVGAQTLKVWSSGCSTGQEAYSVAMMLSDKIPEIAAVTRILGTDISKETVDKAKNGIYTQFEVDRGLPEELKKRYFAALPNGNFQINEKIRSMAEFKIQNLISDPFPGSFDFIFFRNVAIYFTEEQRKILYLKMKNSLNPDGILILGSAESLSGYITDYITREYGLARYYELNASQVTIFKR